MSSIIVLQRNYGDMANNIAVCGFLLTVARRWMTIKYYYYCYHMTMPTYLTSACTSKSYMYVVTRLFSYLVVAA